MKFLKKLFGSTKESSLYPSLELLNRLLRADGKSEVEKTFFNKVESSFEAES